MKNHDGPDTAGSGNPELTDMECIRVAGGQADLDDPRYDYVIYTMQPGDTLVNIAERYETTVVQICVWNGISNPNRVYPGIRLVVRVTYKHDLPSAT